MSQLPQNPQQPLYTLDAKNGDIHLHSPTRMPYAGHFLWNRAMMIHMTCRGYANAHHMQPEPAKYSRGPSLEATSFMQPEHHYYAHHPGRFFYLQCDDAPLFSLPYEPVRSTPETFRFTASQHSLAWQVRQHGLQCDLSLSLLGEHAAEHWCLVLTNTADTRKKVKLTPYFSVGFMSWMNQSASFDAGLNAIVANSITPYQKSEQYHRQQHFKDMTFLLSEQIPDSWTADQSLFEGEGGLGWPDALRQPSLPNRDALYAQPAAIMQYSLSLAPGETRRFRWLFGPAHNRSQIAELRTEWLAETFDSNEADSRGSQHDGLQIATPDKDFDHFVNHWLPRQLRYHGESNRLTTDPQTRNYLQDSLGLIFLDADQARRNFLTALSQQSVSGAMPDGVLLHPDAELKYINQVPHSDHNVWLVIFMDVYLRETADVALLEVTCGYQDAEITESVSKHITRAMEHLKENLDARDLSLIHQGDWCDPMNMVGYRGRGVSAWLTMASAYVFRLWGDICQRTGQQQARQWSELAARLNQAIERHFWTGRWYARGITDDGRTFGTPADDEGCMFLNAQSWALLAGAAPEKRVPEILSEIDAQLQTPYGPQMLAPAYTRFQPDIGRLTQKFPGTAENGSVYNHAAAYYAYSLYICGDGDRAFEVLKKMLPRLDDAETRGQLPNFLPNYYRGAIHQHPQTAGRSSQLFNTGTVAWYYLCVIEGLFGLRGHAEGLSIVPQLPPHWDQARVSRDFAGARFEVQISRDPNVTRQITRVNGKGCPDNLIRDIVVGKTYEVTVLLPMEGKQ